MKAAQVRISNDALNDLDEIAAWLAPRIGAKAAEQHVERFLAFCEGLAWSPLRGSVRNDVRPGLRMVGFRNYGTVFFYADEDTVEVARILARGRDVARAFGAPDDPHND